MREHKDKINWEIVSYSQTLSESFMVEFKDRLDWGQIGYCQKISLRFMRRFREKFDDFIFEKTRKEKLKENLEVFVEF